MKNQTQLQTTTSRSNCRRSALAHIWCSALVLWLSHSIGIAQGPKFYATDHASITYQAAINAGFSPEKAFQLSIGVAAVDWRESSWDWWSFSFVPNDQYVPEHHFDRPPGETTAEAFAKGAEYVRNKVAEAEAKMRAGDEAGALAALESALHAIEDLKCHSNYADLDADKQKEVEDALWNGTALPSGFWLTDYDAGADDPGNPPGSDHPHDRDAKDSSDSANHDKAVQAAVREATDLLNRVKAALTADQWNKLATILFIPDPSDQFYQYKVATTCGPAGCSLSNSAVAVTFPMDALPTNQTVAVLGVPEHFFYYPPETQASNGAWMRVVIEIRAATPTFQLPAQATVEFTDADIRGFDTNTLGVYYTAAATFAWTRDAAAFVQPGTGQATFQVWQPGWYAIGGFPVAHILTWTGTAGFDWDTTTTNWSGTNGATPYAQSDSVPFGDHVTFDDTGAGQPVVNLTTNLTPMSLTVSNSTTTYLLIGTGQISGFTGLSKDGPGTLTIANSGTNNFYGDITVSNGTLQIGNGDANGNLPGGALINLVGSDSALVFSRTDTNTLLNRIIGSGSLTMDGTGHLVLSASNGYSGLTTISSGTLHPRNASALGTSAAGTLVQAGGQIYIDANFNFTNECFTLNGTAPAALHKGGGGVSTLGGTITLGADTTILLDTGSTLNFTNVAGLSGADANLTLAGLQNPNGNSYGNVAGPICLGTGGLTVSGGRWTVAPTNIYSGLTTLSGGRLRIRDVAALGAAPAVRIPNQITMAGGSLEAMADIALTDGKIGLTVNANSYLIVDAGFTLAISNEITGPGGLTKWLPGTLLLTGPNSFTGNFYLDSSSASANDGITRIASSSALAGVPVTPGIPTILQRNNNAGFSTLQLDGSVQPVTLPPEFYVASRNNTNPNIENLTGTNTLSGNIILHVGGSNANFQSDAGLLVLSGTNQYLDSGLAARSYIFTGAGDHLVSGPILHGTNGSPISLVKSGNGKLTLSAANTYGAATIINSGVLELTGSLTSTGGVSVVGGTLAGTGTINDNVTVQVGGTLSPGAWIGTLTISSNLTLRGTTSVEISKTTGASDQVIGLATVTYGGTLMATNLSGILNLGDSFPLFSTAAYLGNFTTVTGDAGAGQAFSFNPTNGVLSVVVGVASYPTNLSYGVSGATLSLSWPATHLGWYAQSNSVSVANSAAWYDIPDSQSATSLSITITPAEPQVFYRLRHP